MHFRRKVIFKITYHASVALQLLFITFHTFWGTLFRTFLQYFTITKFCDVYVYKEF